MRRLFRRGRAAAPAEPAAPAINEPAAEPEPVQQVQEAAPPAFEPRNVTHTYGGLELTIHLGEEVGASWYDVDWEESPEVWFFRDHGMDPGSLVFDLGAHQGVYALLFANAVGPRGRVVAVEASEENVRIGETNCNLNNADNITYLHAAVAETPGWISFGRGSNGQIGDFGDSEQVRAVTIDELAGIYGHPDVLFLDIEGYECRALAAASETLKRRPITFVEVHLGEGLEEFGGSVEQLLELLPASDYDHYVSHENARWPVPFDPVEHASIIRERFFLTALPK
jgi:FkbM family methyltransferase